MAERALRVRVSICLRRGQEILLVEHRTRDRRRWLLPGGGVEVGETLAQAARREVREETGIDAEVGRLLLLSEVIEPAGRHLLDLVFDGHADHQAAITVGADGVLCDAVWHPREALAQLEIHPPLGDALLACWDEHFQGPVRVLGNVWRPAP